MRSGGLAMQRHMWIRSSRARAQLALTVALSFVAVAHAARAQAPPDFDLPTDAATPVLVLRTWPGELGPSAARELRVFADGRCEHERARFAAGGVRTIERHAFRIAPSEARALVAQAIDAGGAELDARAVKRALRAAAADDGVHHYVFDDDVVELSLALARLRASGRPERRDVRHSLRWPGLRGDRRAHAGDARVEKMGSLVDALEAMSRANAASAASQ